MSTDQEPASPPVLTTIEASVAHIVLNRPQARNAITVALATGLAAALRAAAGQARVIVIRGGWEQRRRRAIDAVDALLA